MSSILVTCRNKANVQNHYIPAIQRGGWEGPLRIVAPGEPVPDLETCSGLLLAGGNDVHPRAWDPSEPPHPTAEVDEARDALELPLARVAWRLGLPILGICRGAQVLNVALGGSLIQDIPSRFGCEPDRHRSPATLHDVALDPASRLAGLLGRTEFPVNSRHHQAVGRVAPDLRAVGWHPDTCLDGERLIEAVEAADPERWVFGVQWHPENLVTLDGAAGNAARRIFEAFASAARTSTPPAR